MGVLEHGCDTIRAGRNAEAWRPRSWKLSQSFRGEMLGWAQRWRGHVGGHGGEWKHPGLTGQAGQQRGNHGGVHLAGRSH